MKKELSFFLPVFNEENSLATTVQLICELASKHLTDFEIIIINDGSNDRSPQIAQELAEKNSKISLINFESNRGFGVAYHTALMQARFGHLLYLSADGDANSTELLTLLTAWNGESNLIQYPLNPQERSLHRFYISKLFTFLVNSITGQSWPYYNGFNIYNLTHRHSLQPFDFGFATQAYVLLQLCQTQHEAILVGTQSQYNDSQSKALSFKNINKAFYFFCSILKAKV